MRRLPSWIERLASLRLTIVSLVLMMVIVIVGTLAQVEMGTYAAQQKYFNSFFLYVSAVGARIPIFPGGMSVGALWLVNLVAAFIVRFRWDRNHAGIFISHAGLILLLAGQGITQLSARESMMPLRVGESKNYSESTQEMELALTDISNAEYDEVTVIPQRLLARKGVLHSPRLPFSVIVRRYFPNAALGMAIDGNVGVASQGIGTRIAIQEAPPVSSDDETNNVSALIEVVDGTKSLGTWLASAALGAPQSFIVGGHEYRITVRPRRFYFPFTLTLKEFHHDIYPGTDIPKNFSSLVHLTNLDNAEKRDALIYMNHPLRYEKRTFYQASFGEGDQMSVLQVVQNPVSVAPYIACAVVVIGLAIQFLIHLFDFLVKRS